MPGVLEALADSYRDALERHRNRPLLRATMAACAMMAMADGRVTLRERVRVDQVLEALKALRIFDPHEGVGLFNEFVRVLETDPKVGREQALAAIRAEADKDKEKAELLVRICVGVSRVADATPAAQRSEILRLCELLAVDPRICAFGSAD
jgi:tellurite resistance protein